MAYSDIAAWADMLNEELNEKEFWDESCAKRASEDKALDEKEFEELAEKEIDPKTLGITETEALDEIAEEKAEDDDAIDFSAYGITTEEKKEDLPPAGKIDEADHREPLTAVSTALGKPASTANLTGEDSVRLAEAIERLAGILESKSEKPAEKEIEEADVDQVVDKATLDKLDKIADEIRDESAETMTDADWKKLDDMPEETKEDLEKKINFINDKVNKGAVKGSSARLRLFGLITDYKEIIKSMEKNAANEKAFERAKELQKKSGTRDLTQAEKDEFVKIVRNDLDKDQLEDLAVSRPETVDLEYSLTPADAQINKDSGRERRFGVERKDGDVDSMTDTMGVDSTFKADTGKKDEWSAEYQVDTSIPTEGRRSFKYRIPVKDLGGARSRMADVQKDIDAFVKSADNQKILDYWLANPDKGPADPEGVIPDDWHGGRGKDDDSVQAVRDTALAKKGKSFTPSEWVKLLNTIAKPVRDELKAGFIADIDVARTEAELIDDEVERKKALADCDLEADFIEKLFNGQVTNLNQTEYGVERGYGTGGINKEGGRSLSTGGVTQVKDKITNFILLAICKVLCIDDADVSRFRQNLRAESTAARTVRKELRPVILRKIFEDFGIDPALAPDPNRSLKDKRMFDSVVTTLLKRTWDEASQDERDGLLDSFFDFHDKTLVRKSKSYLTGEQNARFQELKQMALDKKTRDSMEEPDFIDLISLNDIRLHDTNPVQARDKAVKKVERLKKTSPDNPYAVAEWIAREFARGESGVHNLDRTRETFTPETAKPEDKAEEAK